MRRALRLLALVAALGAATSTGKEPAPRMLAMRQLMEHVIDPAADVFWSSSGTVITAQGEASRAPTTDAGWEAAVNAAAQLVEGANLLAMPGRARAREPWLRHARELGEAASAGMKAAQARDERAVFDTGGRIYIACRSCHVKYAPGFQ